MKAIVDKFWKNENIIKLGWLAPDALTNYFFASDLAIFPGTHSVVWEQAVGLGVPCVLKRWRGIEHLDLGGNCMFLNNGDEKEIRDLISKVYANRSIIEKMTNVAIQKGIKHFAYSTIAQKAISC